MRVRDKEILIVGAFLSRGACVHKVSGQHRGTQRWCHGGRRGGSVVAAENTTSLIWVACLPYLLACLPYLLVCCSVPCIAVKYLQAGKT